MPDTILARIRGEKEDFNNENREISPGYTFNQLRLIQRIENYIQSRFDSGPTDEDGWLKPFYNINRKPCAVAAKEIDLDTKDIIIRPEEGDYVTAEIMAAELKQWMKDQGFASDLNEYADLCPQYGTVVLKKVQDRLMTVHLRGLVLSNTQAKTLSHTNVIEPHCYSRSEFLDEAAKKKWDQKKVDEVLEVHDAAGKVDIEVDERYGWCKRSELENDVPAERAEEMVYTQCIAAGTGIVNTVAGAKTDDPVSVEEKGVVLSHVAIDEHPYREWHWSRAPFRWMGVGFVEILFDAQIRANENAYYKAKALAWLATHVYVTDDDTVSRNSLNDAKNGDMIRLSTKGAQLQEIQAQERNLAYYTSEEQRWDKLAADLTFTPEIITGEGLPSGTPARSAIISDQNVKKYYDRKREDFGIFVRGIIEDDILPLFEKQNSDEHVFTFSGSGSDRDAVERRILAARMIGIFQDYVTNRGKIPSSAEWRRMLSVEREKISASPTLDIKIPKGAYKNLKKRLDVVVTKENEDTDSEITGRRTILEVLSRNPGIATNPATRQIFIELAGLLGVKNLNIPTEAEIGAPPEATSPAAPAAAPGLPNGQDVLNAVPVPAGA